jgi:prepilin-type processing-associated H-X9-DG protein
MIAESGLAPSSEPRRKLVEEAVFEKHYNTNYTASWFLVRSGVLLDDSGNLREAVAGCGSGLKSRNSTIGPLAQANADAASTASSFIPLLGCGAPCGTLLQPIGPNGAGTPVVCPFTNGPVLNPSMVAPAPASGTTREGADGWWALWTNQTLQDYRGFAPVHRGAADLLFADGSVRAVIDENEDGQLNNGFQPTADNGFADSEIELPVEDVLSRWSLKSH